MFPQMPLFAPPDYRYLHQMFDEKINLENKEFTVSLMNITVTVFYVDLFGFVHIFFSCLSSGLN